MPNFGTDFFFLSARTQVFKTNSDTNMFRDYVFSCSFHDLYNNNHNNYIKTIVLFKFTTTDKKSNKPPQLLVHLLYMCYRKRSITISIKLSFTSQCYFLYSVKAVNHHYSRAFTKNVEYIYTNKQDVQIE